LGCDDGEPCTDDICDSFVGCVSVNNNDACNDADACTMNDVCVGGACVGGPPPDCNDGNPCTDDSCDSLSGCLHVPNTVPCDDHDACTLGDVCTLGNCHGSPVGDAYCDDGADCTVDHCDSANGCLHDPANCGAVILPLDIKPGLCPNPVNVYKDNLIVAVLAGTPTFDPVTVDPSTLQLVRMDGVGGAATPIASTIAVQDMITPFQGVPCDCHALLADTRPDLRMKFAAGSAVDALQLRLLPDGAQVGLQLVGRFWDGAQFRATDCIEIEGKPAELEP
jgi:hypothetical protein